ncbi:hypothetical protein SCLCIDRAFT_90843, partial [Scleroderma citrinum Foug A]
SFIIPGLMYRSLVSVIQTAFSEPISQWFHFTPFKCIWKSALGREQHVFDELYSSDAWNKAHNEIQKQKRTDNCQLERVVAGLMFWSDSTHLAQFGHSSAWPIYLFFGNLSKYIHASPAPGVCHPIAFIPPQQKGHSDLLAHCKQELFHTVWNILLDDNFIKAYKNGIVVKCFDGIYRCIYPRISRESFCDMGSRVLLATICDKGYCPCPWCIIPKSKFWQVGWWNDIKARVSQARTNMQDKIVVARDAIYQLGAPIKGNAFTERLSPLGFELFPIIVVDFMHEFELGILKNVFKQLAQILHAIAPANIARLNEQYV